jgi:transposase
LWVVLTAVATVFTLAGSRGHRIIQSLLGEAFAG